MQTLRLLIKQLKIRNNKVHSVLFYFEKDVKMLMLQHDTNPWNDIFTLNISYADRANSQPKHAAHQLLLIRPSLYLSNSSAAVCNRSGATTLAFDVTPDAS